MNEDQSAQPLGYTAMGQQEATQHRQEIAGTRLEVAEEYAVKSQTHLWLAIVTHKAPADLLDALDGKGDGTPPLLDLDSMMGQPGVACYVCSAVYEPRLRLRKCPGDR